MNKKIFLLFVILMMMVTIVYAANPIAVQLNGEYIDFKDEQGNTVNPEMINSRTMVPMRKIFEVVGANVEWDGAERKITATTENKIIVLQINNNSATVQDKKTEEIDEIVLDSAPVILNNRTMVPVRFIAESLERQVGWDNENRTVIIIDYSFIEEEIKKNAPTFVEFLNMEKETMDSYKSKTIIDGDIIYKDGENKKNNEKVEIEGELVLQKNKDDVCSLELEIETEGNGEIQKSLEIVGIDDFDYKLITDGNNTYVKSSAADTKKWVESSLIFNVDGDEELNLEEYIERLKVSEEDLTINSYNELKSELEVLYELYGDDNFKVSGTKNKKYELSFDLAKAMEDMNIRGILAEFLSTGSFNLKITVSYRGKAISKVDAAINFYIQKADTNESIEINVDTTTTYSSINSNIKLTMPKASEIEKEG